MQKQYQPSTYTGAYVRFGNLIINLAFIEEVEIKENSNELKIHYSSGESRSITDSNIVSFFKSYFVTSIPDFSNKEVAKSIIEKNIKMDVITK